MMHPLGLLALAAAAFAAFGWAAAQAGKHLRVVDVSFDWLALLSIHTSALNRHFVRLGRQHKRPLQTFFNLAPPVAAALAGAALCMLARETWAALFFCHQLLTRLLSDSPEAAGGAAWAAAQSGTRLALAVPGATIPWAHAGYLWIAAAVSLAVHEGGHALAAAAEGIALHHVAFFLAIWLPGAYVSLDSDGLAALTPWRVLRIVCAGVWINGLLCLVCWLASLLLPALLLPLYSTGQGAVIWAVPQQSALRGILQPGDVVTGINSCAVRGVDSLRACIHAQDAWQPPMAAAARQRRGSAAALTGERLMRAAGSGETSGDAADVFALGADGLPAGDAAVGAAAEAAPPEASLPTSQRGYCVPDAVVATGQACTLDMRLPRGSVCEANELCFADVNHDFGAASLQGAMELLTADADVERHVLRAAPDAIGGRITGSCLRARHVAAGHACDSLENACPPGSTCLGPLLHYGAHMFKVSYRPGPWHDAAAATAAAVPAESTDYPGSSRRRLALHGPEQLRSAQEQLQAQRQAQQQQEQASGIAGDADSSTMPLAEKVIMKGQRLVRHRAKDVWRADLSGQLQPWVVGSRAEAETDPRRLASGTDGASPAAAARTTQQQGHGRRQQQQAEGDPFLVWVGVSSEAAAAFEVTGYQPRGALPPLCLPAVLEHVCSYMFAVSAALAVLNMLPLTWLDGGQALQAALAIGRWEAGPLVVPGCEPSARGTVRMAVQRVTGGLLAFVLASHVLRLVVV